MRYFVFLCLILLLSACGRKHPGSIINDTGETVLVTLKLADSNPDNFLHDDIVSSYKAGAGEPKAIGDYVINYDSVTKWATLKFLPNDTIYLGTVRAGGSGRDEYTGWEFTEITCKGDKGYRMHAKNEQIMEYVDEPLFFSDYEFVIE